MSLDLTLLPFDHESDVLAYSHTVLPMSQNSRVFEVLVDMPAKPVPARFTSFYSRDEKYEEPHYGATVETPYGEPLTCVTIREFLRVCAGLDMGRGEQTRAALAYLAARDPETKVALYWH